MHFLQEIFITPEGSLDDFILELAAIGNREIFGHLTATDLRSGTEGLVQCAGGLGLSRNKTFLWISAFWMRDLYDRTGVSGGGTHRPTFLHFISPHLAGSLRTLIASSVPYF